MSPGQVAQLIGEHRPVHQKFAGSIPSQNTYLSCLFNPLLGCIQEATSQCNSLTSMFLSHLPLSLSVSLSSINISLDKDFLKAKTAKIDQIRTIKKCQGKQKLYRSLWIKCEELVKINTGCGPHEE